MSSAAEQAIGGYHRHSPSSPLADYIDHFWLLEDFPASAKQMIVPDGGVELILNCGGPQRLHDRTDHRRFALHRDAWISGLRHAPIVIGTSGPMSIIGVRFKLFGAYRFLGTPMHELSDQVLDATCVLGRAVLGFRDRIACARTPAEKFALFEDFLLQRLRPPPRAEKKIFFAMEKLTRENSEWRVGALAGELAVSSKHLRRLCRDYVGMAPKAIFRIFRFQRVLMHLETLQSPDWAGVAARFEFFDQPHLVKEFRAFTDSAPTEYWKRRGPYLNYLETP